MTAKFFYRTSWL